MPRPDRRRWRGSAMPATWSCGPPPPRTPCFRCWPATPGCACSWPPASRPTSAASAPGAAGCGCPSAPMRRAWSASWPSMACGRSASIRPTALGSRLARPARAGAHPGGRGGRADRLADGGAGVERPHAATPCIPTTATTTAAPCTTCAPGTTRAACTTRSARASWHVSTRATSWSARPRAWTPTAAERGRPGLLTCALDTELLGHWWYEGQYWLAGVVEEAAAAGLELTTVSGALERTEPVERALALLDAGGSARTCPPGTRPRVAAAGLRGAHGGAADRRPPPRGGTSRRPR